MYLVFSDFLKSPEYTIDHFGRWTLDRNFDWGLPDDATIYTSNALPQ
jgi:hypothetical protein